MTIKDAMNLWIEKHPDIPVSFQTIRNWAARFGFGKKQCAILPRSKWIIDSKKFNKFVEKPEEYLNAKEVKNANHKAKN